MSRLDAILGNKQYQNYDNSFDNGISNIITDFSKKEQKVLIVDFDSIIHACAYPRREEMRDPYTIEEIDEIIMPKIKERIFSLEEAVKEYFDIKSVYLFIGGKNNYRRIIYPEYKANRSTPMEILPIIYQKCIDQLNVKRADEGLEADDMLLLIGREFKDYAVLSYIDKDLDQIGMDIPVYNYNKNIWYKVSDEEARKNLILQM